MSMMALLGGASNVDMNRQVLATSDLHQPYAVTQLLYVKVVRLGCLCCRCIKLAITHDVAEGQQQQVAL